MTKFTDLGLNANDISIYFGEMHVVESLAEFLITDLTEGAELEPESAPHVDEVKKAADEVRHAITRLMSVFQSKTGVTYEEIIGEEVVEAMTKAATEYFNDRS